MLSRFVSYSVLKRAYEGSPAWIKSLYGHLPYGLRAGSAYRKTRNLIAKTEYLTWPELRARQDAALQAILIHSARNVPFYGRRMSELALDPSATGYRERFRELPLISKDLLRGRLEDFCAPMGPGLPRYVDNTGGSSGEPFVFLKSNNVYPVEQAHMLDQWGRVGFSATSRKLTLRGGMVSDRKDQHWRHNPMYRELAFSSYHLDVPSVKAFWGEVRRFRPEYIHGYPSAIVRFLEIVASEGFRFALPIRAVLCGSEPLFAFQREFIERTTQARAYSWYGQSECVILAGECESSEYLHAFPLYGVLELVDAAGQPIEAPGVEGEIVGTSLNNWAMPFIRYRTGDRGVLDEPGPCAGCGRHYPRLRTVSGRTQDLVHTDSGRAVPVTAFVFGQHFKAFARIRAMQLVQLRPGAVVLKLVPGMGFSDRDEQELRSKMEGAVSGEITVTIQRVHDLERTEGGKTPFVLHAAAAGAGDSAVRRAGPRAAPGVRRRSMK